MSNDTLQNLTPKKEDTRVWEAAFLTSLGLTGNVTEACMAANIARQTAYELRREDEDFAAAWADAMDVAADRLEQAARQRAVDGVDEPVYGSGGQGLGTVKVGTIRRYSDTLLIFLLKGARPEKFRERYDHQVSGPDGGAIPLSVEAAIEQTYGEQTAPLENDSPA